MEILRGMSAGGFHETVYRILEETNDAESEEEDLAAERQINARTIMIVFLFTIAVKLALDTLKELIVDALDPSLMPIVNQIFEEFTMVGMVSLILFMITSQSGWLDELSREVYNNDDPEEDELLKESLEEVHYAVFFAVIAFFLMGIFFLLREQQMKIKRHGSELFTRELNAMLSRYNNKKNARASPLAVLGAIAGTCGTNLASGCRDLCSFCTCGYCCCSKKSEKKPPKAADTPVNNLFEVTRLQEEIQYMGLRSRLIQNWSLDSHFDFAEYLNRRGNKTILDLVTISNWAWIGLTILIFPIWFAWYYALAPALESAWCFELILCVMIAFPLVFVMFIRARLREIADALTPMEFQQKSGDTDLSKANFGWGGALAAFVIGVESMFGIHTYKHFHDILMGTITDASTTVADDAQANKASPSPVKVLEPSYLVPHDNDDKIEQHLIELGFGKAPWKSPSGQQMDVKDLREEYKKADTDNSKYLDEGEFLALLKTCGIDVAGTTVDDGQDLFVSAAGSHEGVIGFASFCELYLRLADPEKRITKNGKCSPFGSWGWIKCLYDPNYVMPSLESGEDRFLYLFELSNRKWFGGKSYFGPLTQEWLILRLQTASLFVIGHIGITVEYFLYNGGLGVDWEEWLMSLFILVCYAFYFGIISVGILPTMVLVFSVEYCEGAPGQTGPDKKDNTPERTILDITVRDRKAKVTRALRVCGMMHVTLELHDKGRKLNKLDPSAIEDMSHAEQVIFTSEINKTFTVFDPNNDGTIDAAELAAVLNAFENSYLNAGKILEVCFAAGSKSAGAEEKASDKTPVEVKFSRFTRWIAQALLTDELMTGKAFYLKLFNLLKEKDADLIELRHLEQVISKLDKNLDMHDTHELLLDADTDRSKSISFDEFYEFMKDHGSLAHLYNDEPVSWWRWICSLCGPKPPETYNKEILIEGATHDATVTFEEAKAHADDLVNSLEKQSLIMFKMDRAGKLRERIFYTSTRADKRVSKKYDPQNRDIILTWMSPSDRLAGKARNALMAPVYSLASLKEVRLAISILADKNLHSNCSKEFLTTVQKDIDMANLGFQLVFPTRVVELFCQDQNQLHMVLHGLPVMLDKRHLTTLGVPLAPADVNSPFFGGPAVDGFTISPVTLAFRAVFDDADKTLMKFLKKTIRVSSATGSNADIINGVFESNGELFNDKILYTKRDTGASAKVWLMYGKGKRWIVGDSKHMQADDDSGFAFSETFVEGKEKNDPSEANRSWKVLVGTEYIQISNATGKSATMINGRYERRGLCMGKTAYVKHTSGGEPGEENSGSDEVWLRYGVEGYWMVCKDANDKTKITDKDVLAYCQTALLEHPYDQSKEGWCILDDNGTLKPLSSVLIQRKATEDTQNISMELLNSIAGRSVTPNSTNSSGDTLLDIALKRQAKECIALLKRLGGKKRAEMSGADRPSIDEQNRRIGAGLYLMDKLVNDRLRVMYPEGPKVKMRMIPDQAIKSILHEDFEHFEKNTTVISEEYEAVLKQVAEAMKFSSELAATWGLPDCKFTVEGHTNVHNEGSKKHSWHAQMSTDRANVVKKKLEDYGVKTAMLTSRGKGGAQPLFKRKSSGEIITSREGSVEPIADLRNARVEFPLAGNDIPAAWKEMLPELVLSSPLREELDKYKYLEQPISYFKQAAKEDAQIAPPTVQAPAASKASTADGSLEEKAEEAKSVVPSAAAAAASTELNLCLFDTDAPAAATAFGSGRLSNGFYFLGAANADLSGEISNTWGKAKIDKGSSGIEKPPRGASSTFVIQYESKQSSGKGKWQFFGNMVPVRKGDRVRMSCWIKFNKEKPRKTDDVGFKYHINNFQTPVKLNDWLDDMVKGQWKKVESETPVLADTGLDFLMLNFDGMKSGNIVYFTDLKFTVFR